MMSEPITLSISMRVTSEKMAQCLDADLLPFVNEMIDRVTQAGCPQSGLPECLALMAGSLISEADRIREFNATGEAQRET